MSPEIQSINAPLIVSTPNYNELLKKVEDYVNIFYREHADPNLYYHNHSHILEVLDNTKLIANHYQLDDRTFFIVCAAACFHDTGYQVKNAENHEQKSAELAHSFLNSLGAAEEDIIAIKNCIMATKMPQMPQTLADKIICDADLFNLGTSSFKENNKLLKKEEEAFGKKIIEGITWRASSIKLLENHTYHTDYCQLILNKTKAENLKKLKAKQEEKLTNAKTTPAVVTVSDDAVLVITDEDDTKNIKEKKKKRPSKGIETMFRISASKNIRISEMADSKANIMISVNSIILSVVLGLTIKNLDEHRNLIVPTIILMIVNLTTIIYAVLATRPKIPNGFFTKEDVDKKSVNLLYFGSFYNMNFKEYHEGLKAMMADSEFLYSTLTKDTFWQGKVLGRKYHLLRISYTVFLYGIVTAVAAFAVSVIFFS